MPFLHSEVLDDPLLYERQESFVGGMDAYQRATLLGESQSQILQNVIIEDNHLAKTRYGTTVLGAAYPDAAGSEMIQGLFFFELGAVKYLLAIINARFWVWNNTAWAEIAAPAGWATNKLYRFGGCQALDKLYLTDGSGNWVSFDGTTLVDLGSVVGIAGDPPVGATMAIFVGGRVIAAGPTALPDTLWASTLLEAGTGKWNHTEDSFRVGAGDGEPITALVPIRDNYFVCFKTSSIYLINADPAATVADWVVYPLTRGVGCVGKRAAVQLGNDVLFLSQDGIRTINRAEGTSDYQVGPALSEPLQPYIDRINWDHADLCCAIKYEQYAFFAVPLDTASSPDYVLAFNARLGSWMGVWTGWTPTDWCVTRFNAASSADVLDLVFGESGGYVHRWTDDGDEDIEATYRDKSNLAGYANIATLTRSKAYNFGEPISTKTGFFYEVRVIETEGDVNVKAYLDDEQQMDVTQHITSGAPILPVPLDFVLGTTKPQSIKRSLFNLEPFNEVYLEVSKAIGKLCIKHITLAAFLNTLDNE